ncbi:hypothetical protein PUN28_015228 [Cardiocondyla obscurior]|uniref:MADF domain-containing protein n=1 Tax=Cardiocondyla obscurior TaxID=286306 RepID=A0AAW2F3Z1_9HYME
MDHLYDKQIYSQSDVYFNEFEQDISLNEVNTEDDATLIDIIRGYPHLYAKNLKDFKNKNVREQSWLEIASILKCSVEDCQRRWLRLRDRFSKERRLRDTEIRSGSGRVPGRKEFCLYDNMMFLSEHIQSRKTYTNLHVAKQKSVNLNPASPISSSIQTFQNPSSPTLISLSPLMSPSSSENSRNTPSPQIQICQQSPTLQNNSRNTPSPQIQICQQSPTLQNNSRNTPSPQIQICQQSPISQNISKNVPIRNSALLLPHTISTVTSEFKYSCNNSTTASNSSDFI